MFCLTFRIVLAALPFCLAMASSLNPAGPSNFFKHIDDPFKESGGLAPDSLSQVMSPSSSIHGTNTGETGKKSTVVTDNSVPAADYVQGLPVVFGEAIPLPMSSTSSIPRALGAQSAPSGAAAAVQAAAAS